MSKGFLVVYPETCSLLPTLNNMWLPLMTDSKLIAQLKGIFFITNVTISCEVSHPRDFLESTSSVYCFS